MKIIEGFERAKSALSRQASKEVFGGNDREQAVRQIITEVRQQGDAALLDYTFKLDGVRLTSLEITKEQISRAYREVDAELVSALKLAAGRIHSFHTAQKKAIWSGFSGKGLGRIRPIQRVGVYAPGGSASYPSTVLMTAIPARVAGVKEVILVTPPGSSGTIPALTLVAADIAQVDRVFTVGGAQAIAALAFGTESIPAVDKICGPGNIFVVLAKKMVYGVVGIDGLQGPSEVVIIADETANPEYCAADLLAQAEHDSLASAILITTSRQLADRVNQEVERQLESLPRRAIAAESLANRGLIVVAGVNEAIELANLYAPEHLCLMVDKATSYIDRVTNAGCVVVGEKATVVLGDYIAGPSHVLPTGGTARFSSPLNVADFIKLTNVITVDDADLKELGGVTQALARAEGLEAHTRAVGKRLAAD
ncbi:MAG: histidinol dehydrogenase [Chloroflexi bacterium]|nr:histidinol dehydrogenase [Chloroflexota bacterium]